MTPLQFTYNIITLLLSLSIVLVLSIFYFFKKSKSLGTQTLFDSACLDLIRVIGIVTIVRHLTIEISQILEIYQLHVSSDISELISICITGFSISILCFAIFAVLVRMGIILKWQFIINYDGKH